MKEVCISSIITVGVIAYVLTYNVLPQNDMEFTQQLDNLLMFVLSIYSTLMFLHLITQNNRGSVMSL